MTLSIVLSPHGLWAQDQSPTQVEESQLVEVRIAPDTMSPYRERRTSWSPTFSLGSLFVKPTGFVSGITDSSFNEYTYEDLFGSKSMNVNSFSAGIQFNLSGFSIGPYIGVKSGAVVGDGAGGSNSLNLTAQHAGLALNLDGLFAEPYVVPTLQIDMNVGEYNESFNSLGVLTEAQSAVKPFMSYTAGVLVQLNWLDPESAFESLKDSGLNNTFLHVFAGQLMATAEGVSFNSPLSYGAGLKLEF